VVPVEKPNQPVRTGNDNFGRNKWVTNYGAGAIPTASENGIIAGGIF
jgi:hypothetical protein